MRQQVSSGGCTSRALTSELRKMAEVIEMLQKCLGPMPDAVLTALIEEKVRHELASYEATRREPSLN